MELDPWLLFAHITGAALWVGGGVALSVIGWRLRRRGDLTLLAEFARTLRYLGLRVLTPAVLVVLITGVSLILARSGDFTRLWVVLGLGAFALAFLIGAGFLSRAALRLERVTSGSAPDAAAARDALGQWLLGYGVVLAILVFALWDMVFKPHF